jgi:hypothetical protein
LRGNVFAKAAMRLTVLAFLAMMICASNAMACACCSNEGQRHVATVDLDSAHLEAIDQLRFGATATLFTGEGDADAVAGIAPSTGHYTLTVTRSNDGFIFNFTDDATHRGTLTLAVPRKIKLFEVDPRDRPDQGQGPRLYKEWTLSSSANGGGIFRKGIGRRQTLTLVLQGHGNGCTSVADFTHWSLVMAGQKTNYTLFGDLGATP